MRRLEKPENRALVWCDDNGEEKTFTFADMSRLSNQAANYFKSLGLHKGSVVMMILRRRYEYWICATALIKLGVIIIPGTLQLTTHDLVYRAKAANIEMFIGINDDFVVEQIENTVKEVPEVKNIMLVDGHRDGWLNLHDGMEGQSEELERPTGAERTHNHDIMQIYFTSGTTGMPKMVCHNYMHPLGHIVTAKYWQCVRENMLHMSVSDSGWAKFGWGKIYGQWICGATVFCYDMLKFHPDKLLGVLQKYKVTTFCAPPTMYRFMLQEDVAAYDLSSVQRWCTAGEPLNPEVVKKWKGFTGYTIAEGFGQTESTVLLANFPWYEPKPGSMGKPSPIYNIKLLNSEGNEAEDGEEGEITVAVPKDEDAVVYHKTNIGSTNGLAMYFPYDYPSYYKSVKAIMKNIGMDNGKESGFFGNFLSARSGGSSHGASSSPFGSFFRSMDFSGEEWYSADAAATVNPAGFDLTEEGLLALTDVNGGKVLELTDEQWDEIAYADIGVYLDDGEG